MTQEIEHEENKPKVMDSILVKLSIITIIILVLLIPSAWIQSMIDERDNSQQAMMNNVSDKWSGKQLIQGPVLVIPYKKITTETDNGKKTTTTRIETAYLLPEKLSIKAGVKTELFHQGVIDATVYNSKIALLGTFAKPDFAKMGIAPDLVLYDKARLVFSLSDLKGLKSNPIVHIQNQEFNPEPTYTGNSPFEKGLQVGFTLSKDAGFTFGYDLDLKGSDELNFLHIGKITEVEVTSDWKTPTFDGRYLPDSRKISATGFHAKWKMLYYNRPFPQQWMNDDTVLTSKKATDEALFGVKFNVPVDQYRKTTRTTRYSTLIIALTFVSLFFTELIRKQKIHLFNYVLIGAAMIVYYTLLLSFAEHMGFDISYLIASVATITLISWFTASLMH